MAEVSLFDLLGDEERREVLAAARRRRFKRGEVVFHEGDPGDSLHVIDKGHVAVRMTTPLGDVATLTVLKAGEAFGEGALLSDDARRTASAVALEATETRSLGRLEFERLRRSNPAVNDFLVQALAAQVRRLSEHLTEALYVPAETRVLRRVLWLSQQYGATDGQPGVVPLTQDDLASMAGTARPTANRVLKAAEEAGILAVGRGRVEVLDPDALARKAR